MTRPPLPEPPAAYQYLFNSYYGQVWRNDSASWNGSNPVASRTLHTADQMHAYADTCTAELRELIKVLEQDAERYRWLRVRVSGHRAVSSARPATFAFPGPMLLTPLGDIMRGSVAQHLDAAIDAARAELKKP